jgi:thiol-disulfide isomerase/thioredoxin
LRSLSRLAVTLILCGAFSAAAVEVGESVPTVRGPRLDKPGESLPSPRHQVVYVDFWASWCVPCRQSMPVLDELYRKHGAAGFAVVGVNKDVTEADARRFLQSVKVTFPLITDETDVLARAFDVKAMPSGYLVDRKGVVRQLHRGFTEKTTASLEAQIVKLLAEAP